MKSHSKHPKDTRAVLLKCAEKLFFSHGYEDVSIRQITTAAGTNVAAINYHFNGKINLYREILTQHLDEIAHEKLAMLEELDDQHPAANLEQILRTYVRSYFDSFLTSRDNDRLLLTIYREMGPDAVASDLVETRLIRPIHQTFQETILKACPELNEEHASFCVSSITGQVLHFIRGREILRKIRNPDQHQTFIEDAIHHITQFSLRGIGSDQHA
jgi:AcrR family transcriptional regulator